MSQIPFLLDAAAPDAALADDVGRAEIEAGRVEVAREVGDVVLEDVIAVVTDEVVGTVESPVRVRLCTLW